MASRLRLLALLPTVFLCLSAPLLAAQATPRPQSDVASELKVRERYEYYNVDGANVCDLQKQMKNNGTKWNDGKTYAAVTSWDVHYSYDVAEKDGKFAVKSVKTKVDVVYHLPQRVCAVSTPEMTLRWDKYMVNLKHHEYGHKDLTVKVADELNETLSSLQGFESQDELDREAKRRTEEKLEKLKEIQVAYDRDTRHGETQGAILSDEDQPVVAAHSEGAVVAAQNEGAVVTTR